MAFGNVCTQSSIKKNHLKTKFLKTIGYEHYFFYYSNYTQRIIIIIFVVCSFLPKSTSIVMAGVTICAAVGNSLIMD